MEVHLATLVYSQRVHINGNSGGYRVQLKNVKPEDQVIGVGLTAEHAVANFLVEAGKKGLSSHRSDYDFSHS